MCSATCFRMTSWISMNQVIAVEGSYSQRLPISTQGTFLALSSHQQRSRLGQISFYITSSKYCKYYHYNISSILLYILYMYWLYSKFLMSTITTPGP